MKKFLSTFITVLLLVGLTASNPVYAAYSNTHATDLELSSSQSWSIANADQTGLNFTSDFSISVWLKLESAPATDTYFFIGDRDGATRGWNMVYRDNGGTKEIGLFVANGAGNSSAYVASTLSTGTYLHLVGVYTASAGSIQFYVNGSSVGTGTGLRTSINSTTNTFYVGADDVGGENYDGLMNDYRIWSRTLSSGEVSSLYTTPCTFNNGSNLVGWWFINNTLTSTKAVDNSGNNNNLTNNNSATFSTDIPYTCPVVSSFNFWQFADF